MKRRIFEMCKETDDMGPILNKMKGNTEVDWKILANTFIALDIGLQYTVIHPRTLNDEKMFWRTLIHEICEADFIYALFKIEENMFNPDGKIQCAPSVTHYCTVHALNEPSKCLTLPW